MAPLRRPRNIAAIFSNTLLCLGLQNLLEDYFPPVNITCYRDFESFSSSNIPFDYFFIEADSFILNTDFFLQRRSKTVILSGNHSSSPACNLINMNASQEAILDQLQQLFAAESNPEGENKELSSREIDVLQLIVQGNTNKDIADKLCISLNTVLTHRKNITSKLGIKTTSGLTFYALMNGLF